MNVPHGLKRPGVIAVLPRKAAANAGRRNVAPDVGSEAPAVPVYRTPAAAAMIPAATKHPQRTRPTRIPLSLATLVPLPTNRMRRPIAVKSKRLSLIHISEPTRQAEISYAVFCL